MRRLVSIALGLALTAGLLITPAAAHTSGYSQRSPLSLTVVDTTPFAAELGLAVNAWNVSPVVEMEVQQGKSCHARRSAVVICAGHYARSLAAWMEFRADRDLHFRYAVIYLNLNVGSVATFPVFRQYLLCHELGHALGLDHHTEIEGCMGSSGISALNDPGTLPSWHDYEELLAIY